MNTFPNGSEESRDNSFNSLSEEICSNTTRPNNHSRESIDLLIDPFESTYGKGLLIISFVLSTAIIIENGLTLLVILRTPTLRTIQNKYILSLAIADSLVGSALLEVNFKNIIGEDCQPSMALLHTSVGVSMLNMMAIAIDRYLFIVKPFFHMRWITSRFTNVVICSQWALAITLGVVPIFVFDLGKNKNCHPFFTLHHTVLTKYHVVQFTVTTMVTGIVYGLIAKVAKQKADQRRKTVQQFTSVLENSSGDSSNKSVKMKRRKCCFCLFQSAESSRDRGILDKNSNQMSDKKAKSNSSNNSGISILFEKYNILSVSSLTLKMNQEGSVHDFSGDGIIAQKATVSISPFPRIIEQELLTNTASSEHCGDKAIDDDVLVTSHSGMDPEEGQNSNTGNGSTTISSMATSTSHSQILSDPGSNSNVSSTKPSPHSFRWMKQMVLVFGLFVLCWAPSIVTTVLHLVGLIGQSAIYTLSWLGVANSGANFYVYSFMNPQFRKALQRHCKSLKKYFNCKV